jgi:hypothetical protein
VPILPGDSLNQLLEHVFPICGREDQLTPAHEDLDLGAIGEPEFLDERLGETYR